MFKETILTWTWDNDAKAYAARTKHCTLLVGVYHPLSFGAWWRVLIVQRAGTMKEGLLAQIAEGRVEPEGANADLLGCAMRAAEAALSAFVTDTSKALRIPATEVPASA